MRKVFVFEYLTGGGLGGMDAATADELLPLGLSMRDAMAADLLRSGRFAVSVAVCAQASTPPAGAQARQAQPDEPMTDFVARQAMVHDAVWLVAPETGGLLASLRRMVPARRWLGCEGRAIVLASGKRKTSARLAEFGIATPLAFETLATRWIVKPDDGAGGVGTRLHGSLADARADAAARNAPDNPITLEPFVDGEPLSISLLCDRQGVELLSINRQQIEVDTAGRLAYRGVQVNALPIATPQGAALAALATQVAEAIPGLRGFVGIDLVWHPARGPVVIEVNPRVTCAYVGLSASLGRDLAGELMDRLCSTEPAHASVY